MQHWTLTTSQVGRDGMKAHERIRGKTFNQQTVAFGEQILFKPRQTSGPQQKLAVNWLDGCWTRSQHEHRRPHREHQCRSDIRGETKKNARNCELLLGILGNLDACKADAWKSIPTPQHQPDTSPNGELRSGGWTDNDEKQERGHIHGEDASRLSLERHWAARSCLVINHTRRSAEPGSPPGRKTNLHTRNVSKTT